MECFRVCKGDSTLPGAEQLFCKQTVLRIVFTIFTVSFTLDYTKFKVFFYLSFGRNWVLKEKIEFELGHSIMYADIILTRGHCKNCNYLKKTHLSEEYSY